MTWANIYPVRLNWHSTFKIVSAGAVALLLYLSLITAVLQKELFPASDTGTASRQSRAAKPLESGGSRKWTYSFANFPNGPLRGKDWNFETGVKAANYNNEAQTYTKSLENVRVQDGTLVIEAKPEHLNGKNFTSARIDTRGKFSFTYGTLEADMMLPQGTGTWPAAWLMPRDNVYKTANYGIDGNDRFAWALNGEIDFAEAIGSIPGQNIPAAHSYNEVQSPPTYTPGYVDNPYTRFHRYGIIKTPDKITFTLDGEPYATRVKTSSSPLDWPYDQSYYLIINLAVGGNWAGANGIDASSAPWQLKIKSLSYTPL